MRNEFEEAAQIKDINKLAELTDNEFVPLALFIAENAQRSKKFLQSELDNYLTHKLNHDDGCDTDTPIRILKEALKGFEEVQ